MSTNDRQSRRRPWWRLALLLLVALPFLPEILVWAVAAIATIKGCQIDAKTACVLLGVPVSDLISRALFVGLFIATGFGLGVCAGWLAICYLVTTLGWTRLWQRLLVGAVTTAIFAILPYFAPMLAVT